MSRRPFNRLREAMAVGPVCPLILAHRGDSYSGPENTLEAAALAHRAGADGWEFDVRSTADGVAVVLHDATLRRTTDVGRVFPDDPRADLGHLVAEYTHREVLRLDAGSWFLDPAGGPRTAEAFGTIDRLDESRRRRYNSGSVRVPTLDQALALTVGLDWLANVEIKSSHDGDLRLADLVLDSVARAGAADRVLVSSFDHAVVAHVAAAEPTIATGLLSTTPLIRPAAYVRGVVGADAYHLAASGLGAESPAYLRGRSPESLRLDHLDECTREGLPVLVFTVNDPGPGGLAGQLAGAGVAGLFTDDPTSFVGDPIPSGARTRRRSNDTGRRWDAHRGWPTAPGSRPGDARGSR